MKQQSKRELRKQLAENLAAILANPETPSTLYNLIADHMLDMNNEVWNEESWTPRMLRRALDYHARTPAGQMTREEVLLKHRA